MAKKSGDGTPFTFGSGEPTVSADGDSAGGNAIGDSVNVGSSQGFIDPESVGKPAGDGTTPGGEPIKRGRGRPKGSGASASTTSGKASNNQDIGAIEATLLSIHMMLAVRVPEMAIEPSEAKLMAEAIARVSRHYPQVSAVITGKISDHIALFTAFSAVYGTRLLAIKKRMDDAKNVPQNAPNVVTLTPNSNQPFTR